MDYKCILDEIKPTKEEKDKVNEVSTKLIDFLNDKCDILLKTAFRKADAENTVKEK